MPTYYCSFFAQDHEAEEHLDQIDTVGADDWVAFMAHEIEYTDAPSQKTAPWGSADTLIYSEVRPDYALYAHRGPGDVYVSITYVEFDDIADAIANTDARDLFDHMLTSEKKALGRHLAGLVAARTGWDVSFVGVDGTFDQLLTFERAQYRTYRVLNAEGDVLAESRLVDRRSDAAGAGVAEAVYTASSCGASDLTVENIAFMLQRKFTRQG